MRQIILEIEDSVYEQFMGMVALCPQVEIVADGVVAETRGIVDQCVAIAINELIGRKTIRYAFDYAYIMMPINQGLIDRHLFFASPQEFIDYLAEVGIRDLPGKSSLYNKIGVTTGKYPDWSFSDQPTNFETIRRKNVFQQFLSAFLRAKRAMLEGMLESESHVGKDVGR